MTGLPVASSVLALASTAHLVLALVVWHSDRERAAWHPLRAFSFCLAPLPWILPTSQALAWGLATHAAWAIAVMSATRRAAASRAKKAAAAAPARPGRPPSAGRPAGDAYVPLRVLDTFDETGDIRTFRFERPPEFEFTAGQFVTVAVEVQGQRLARCYSLSSSPESRGYLEISVKRQGLVSGALHATVHRGSMLAVRPPAGRFVYPSEEGPIVLIAGGVGCTPLMSMLRHSAACDPTRPVTYLLSVRSEQDIAFRQELALLARRHPALSVVIALSRGAGGPGFVNGRIGEEQIHEHVPDPRASLFYLCGPTAMIDSVREILRNRFGVADERIRFEAFGAAQKSAELSANQIAAARERRAKTSRPGGRARVAHSLSLSRSGRSVPVSASQTLLEAAEAADVFIPSSCRAGVCGTCRTRLIQGDVDCQADALDPRDREKGYVMPCVAFARGDCALEA